MSGALLPAGSTAWLIAHELRLSLRPAPGRKGVRVVWIVLGVFMLAIMGLFVVPAFMLRKLAVHQNPLLIMIFDLSMVAIFTLMLSQTLAAATMAFFERGDLDLLLSSPIPPGRVLAARAIGIATPPILWFCGFASLGVLPMAAVGQLRWLAVYAVIAGLGLMAAAAAISLAMGLFRLIGPRRTRTVGQLLAALVGALFFLVAQARNLLPDHGRQLFGGMMALSQDGVFAPGGPASWPARAVLAEPLPLAVFVAVSLGLFTLVAQGLGRRFAADASVAAGIGSGPARARPAAKTTGSFGGGVFGNVLRKELRLLIRDPALLSQVLLRALYMLPLAFILVNTAHQAGAGTGSVITTGRLAVLAGAVVVMTSQVAGSLAWITISAEDAPDLIACAPVSGGLVRRAKLAAALIPVVVLLAGPLGALVWLSPWVGACAVLGAAAAATSSGMVNLWFEKPTPRAVFRTRKGGSVTAAIAETLVGLGWGLTTGVAAASSIFAVAPAVLTLGGMAVLYAMSAPQRAEARWRS